MVKTNRKNALNDASAGGKRSAMPPGEDPGNEVPTSAGGLAPGGLAPGGLALGAAAIAAAVKTLPGTPGVYRMLDRKGEALYVGKAK
jgi:excinuclease ABC subunit C